MASPENTSPKVDEIFQHREWQAQAAQPGILEPLGRTLDQTLATKGQSLKAYLADLQLAYRMLRDPHFQLDQGTKMTLIIALLYIVSPLDVIPDGIPFLGALDDVLVAGYALKQASAGLERYRKMVQTS
jgi:uncharacterized membrane protein YkvA (DUF1232 family)